MIIFLEVDQMQEERKENNKLITLLPVVLQGAEGLRPGPRITQGNNIARRLLAYKSPWRPTGSGELAGQ